MRFLKSLVAPLFYTWLGGALHMASFYWVWSASVGLPIHWFSVQNIIFWPWYCGLMVVAYCL